MNGDRLVGDSQIEVGDLKIRKFPGNPDSIGN